MYTESFRLTTHDNSSLPAILYLPDQSPKMILQITHGMTEHIGRYGALAQELTVYGIAIAGFDLRGHGKNPGDPEVASFGKNGWEASLKDMYLFGEVLKNRFPELPHYMLGFSLGSFLVREYLGKYPENVDGAIIMGTGHQPGLVLNIMMTIVKGQIKKAGFDRTTDLVRKLSFGTYNQKFKPGWTASDWLCADEAQLDGYLADPLCRKDISAGLFWQLLGSMKRTGSKGTYENWDRNLPILLLSGAEDPVGDSGKGVRAVKQQMKAAGIRNVTMQLLPGARHVVLQEEACGAAAKARGLILNWLLEAKEKIHYENDDT